MKTLVVKPNENGYVTAARVLDEKGETIPYVQTVELEISVAFPYTAAIYEKDKEPYTDEMVIRIE